MENISVIVENYLTQAVKNNKDSLSRQTRKQVKDIVIATNAVLKKFDVLNGTIFIDVDSEETATAIVEKFGAVAGVKASKIDTFQSIYRKAQLRAELEQEKQKQQAESTVKTAQKAA